MRLRRLIDKAQSEVASVSTTPLPHETDGVAGRPGIGRSERPSREFELVERAQRGEAAAVEWLVQDHWDRVQRLLIRMFGARQDLEDLVQTTFLETLRALPSFRRESSLSTFISGIAVRVGLRARRPSKVVRGSLSVDQVAELSSAGPSPESQLEQSEALQRLQAILSRLSDPKRMAFLLWAVEGLHVDDVAQAMHASISATRSRIFYAQKELHASAARDPYLRVWLGAGAGKREPT